MQARPGEVVFHPFISDAGERGPFVAHDACAQFLGLRSRHGYWDLMRAVMEGLALAARDCYAAMGALPRDVRITGGAARSRAARCRGGTSRQVISSCCDANSGNGLGSDRRVPWPA
jgi:erythritol kinase